MRNVCRQNVEWKYEVHDENMIILKLSTSITTFYFSMDCSIKMSSSCYFKVISNSIMPLPKHKIYEKKIN